MIPYVLLSLALVTAPGSSGDQRGDRTGAALPTTPQATPATHHEVPGDPWTPWEPIEGLRATAAPMSVVRGPFVSVQVNTGVDGSNLVGDAANEPSIAVDPTNPNRMAIGWRQFDTIASNFRQAGVAYSHDGGESWTFPGVLDPGVFRSDPVLESNANGVFFYSSLTVSSSRVFSVQMFQSFDGGMSWGGPIAAFGGDKQWMTIDRTTGVGRNNIYQIWNIQFTCCTGRDFTRAGSGGFEGPYVGPRPAMKWGTMAVGPDGTLFLAGSQLDNLKGHLFSRSTNATDRTVTPTFEPSRSIHPGGLTSGFRGLGTPNPDGLLGQVVVATDDPGGPCRGRVYVLASVDPLGPADPLDVMFIRSVDGGFTWSAPLRVNNDAVGNGAYQWFGTMSVSPNGRIDAIWNDTRNGATIRESELFYAWSYDGGRTWFGNVPVSPSFDSHVGWPNQRKLGDYYELVSDNSGANVAYAGTFNGEQDVYFLRLWPDCDGNGLSDAEDIALGNAEDCSGNGIPDDCEPDCNGNGFADSCDILFGRSSDVTGTGVPDECDFDFDGDTVPDGCDADMDNDVVPNAEDVCVRTPQGLPVDPQGRARVDGNLNCRIDLADYEGFRSCLDGGGPGANPGTCVGAASTDGDLDVDLRDVAAIQRVFGIGP